MVLRTHPKFSSILTSSKPAAVLPIQTKKNKLKTNSKRKTKSLHFNYKAAQFPPQFDSVTAAETAPWCVCVCMREQCWYRGRPLQLNARMGNPAASVLWWLLPYSLFSLSFCSKSLLLLLLLCPSHTSFALVTCILQTTVSIFILVLFPFPSSLLFSQFTLLSGTQTMYSTLAHNLCLQAASEDTECEMFNYY